MTRGVKKENLPTKTCVTCNWPFTWRKKWENCWDEVQTCSKRCKSERKAKPRKEEDGGSPRDQSDQTNTRQSRQRQKGTTGRKPNKKGSPPEEEEGCNNLEPAECASPAGRSPAEQASQASGVPVALVERLEVRGALALRLVCAAAAGEGEEEEEGGGGGGGGGVLAFPPPGARPAAALVAVRGRPGHSRGWRLELADGAVLVAGPRRRRRPGAGKGAAAAAAAPPEGLRLVEPPALLPPPPREEGRSSSAEGEGCCFSPQPRPGGRSGASGDEEVLGGEGQEGGGQCSMEKTINGDDNGMATADALVDGFVMIF